MPEQPGAPRPRSHLPARRGRPFLRDSDDRFRVIADAAPVLMWMSGPEGGRTWLNRRWLEFTGRTADRELGNGWADSIHPDDVGRTLAALRTATESRQPFEVEYRLRRADGQYRWLIDRGVPRLARDGAFAGFIGAASDIEDRRSVEQQLSILLSRESVAHARADQAQQRASFLAQASRTFAGSLDYELTLRSLARVAVPTVADLCVIDLLEHGVIRRVAAAHADPANDAVVATLLRRFPPDPQGRHPVAQVLKTGRSEIAGVITDEIMARITEHPDHRNIAQLLNYTSYMVVPMIARGQILGAISLVSGESGRRYGIEDLALAEDLGQRAAAAVENARLYREAQQRQREAEELARVARALTETQDLATMGARIVQNVVALFGTESCALRLVRPDGSMELIAAAGPAREHLLSGHVLPAGVGTVGRAVREGRTAWTADALTDGRIVMDDDLRTRLSQSGASAILAAPLRVDGRTIGVLSLAGPTGHEYSPREVALAQGFADQVALAVERARLHEESEQRRRAAEAAERQARFLAETSASLTASLDYEALAQKVAGLAVPFLADWCAVDMLQPDGVVRRLPVASADPAKADAARALQEYPLSSEPEDDTPRVLRTGRPEVVSEIDRQRLEAAASDLEHRRRLEEMGYRSTIVVPLTARGQILGALTLVMAESGRRYDAADLPLAEELAHRIASAFDNARLFRDSEARRQEAQALSLVGRRLSETLDPEEVARRTVEAVQQLLGTRAAVFYRVDPVSGDLHLLARLGSDVDWIKVLPRGTATVWLAVRDRQPISTPDVLADPRINLTPESRAQIERAVYRSVLAVPVLTKDEVVGALAVGDRRGRIFDADEIRLLQTFAQQAALALENARLYAKEQSARQEAETASRMKDEFLATLSHELRTPLNAMMGWTTMLRGGRLDEAAAARALESVERNVRLQARLIEDLLDVSRIITGKFQLDLRPLELPPVIEAAGDAVRPAADAKGIALDLTLDRSAGPVLGDPARLQQVVWNLLSNAVKFTTAAGRVEVQLTRAGTEAAIRVTDTGIGIRPEVLPHIFERFLQGDSSTTRRYGGLGLGLAIVRHIVELHGGTVHAESPGEGQGARFTVLLPLASFASPTWIGGGTVRVTDSGDLAGLRVLVVDDDSDTLDLARTILSAGGAGVRTCMNVAQALEALTAWMPDLLLADIGLPDEDGYVLIQKLRALGAERGGRIPAVALSAYARVEDRERALTAGYQAYLSKPVEPAELRRTVRLFATRPA